MRLFLAALVAACLLSRSTSFLLSKNHHAGPAVTTLASATRLFASNKRPSPPPPNFVPKPLPVLLGGGLFLFRNSVQKQDKEFAQELLLQCQVALRACPTVAMELGQGMECGGVYASQSGETSNNIKQLVLQFQIEGGNAWAQGVAYGIKLPAAQQDEDASDETAAVQLVSLEVANMDASMNGTPLEVAVNNYR
jgi:hypothetical protein